MTKATKTPDSRDLTRLPAAVEQAEEAQTQTVPAVDRIMAAQRNRLLKKHEAVLSSMADSVQHAIEAGQILLEVKATLAHGAFRVWVESLPSSNFPLSYRTAQRYMQIAANVEKITSRLREKAEATRVSPANDSDLWTGVSLREAIRLLVSHDGPQSSAITAAKAASPRKGHDLLTPWPLVEAVQQCLGHVDLDPCGHTESPDHVAASCVWTISDDGLDVKKKWTGRVFVHPPHNERQKWVDRSLAEIAAGNAEALLLLIPVVSDDAAFLSLKHCPRGFIGSRIDGFDSPGVVFALGDVEVSRFAETFDQHGDVFVPVSDR